MTEQVNVTVNEPTVEVIAVTVEDTGAESTSVSVSDTVVQVVGVDVTEPAQHTIDVTVTEPIKEVVEITVLGGGVSNSSVPDGGATGQILAKASPINQDMEWINNSYDASVYYVDSVMAAHESGTVDVHDADGITFTPPPSGTISLWLTGADVQTALTQVASQLYAPDEETMEAMIAAANALVGGTNQEFTNPDILANDIIVTRHMLAGSISASILDVTTINATLISANALYSSNYTYTSGPYSDAGTFFDLSNGDILSEEFSLVNGAVTLSSNATIGILTADQLASSAEVAAAETAAQAAADAAEAAAVVTANAYADGEITASEAVAIATAEADATVKADAAEAAAIAAAQLYTDNEFVPGNINPNVTSIDGGVITTGFLNADRIDVNTITADKLNITNLAAINSDLGAITAGSIDIGTGNFTVDSAGNLTAESATIKGTIQGVEFELYDPVVGVGEVQSEWVSNEDPFDSGVVNNALVFRHNDVAGSNNVSGFYWDSDNPSVTLHAGTSSGSRSTYTTTSDGNIFSTTGDYHLDITESYVRISNAALSGEWGVDASGPYIDGNVNANGAVITNVNEIQLDVGSATDPSLLFDSNTNSGLYSQGGAVAITRSGEVKAVFGADRLYLYGGTGNADYIGPLNSTYFYIATASDYVYLNKPLRVDTGTITSHNEDLLLQDSAINVMQLDGSSYVNGNVLIYSRSNDGSGQQTALRLYPSSAANESSGGTNGMLFQTTYSTDRHVHARVYYGNGDELGFRNYENTAWVPLRASAFNVGSDAKYKQRIRSGRSEHHPFLEGVLTEDRQLAFDKHRAVTTVIYDNAAMEKLYEWAGCPGEVHDTRDECVEDGCSGKDNMVTKEHHCDEYVCGGTDQTPCWLIERDVDVPGFLAQNVELHYPKVVQTDFNNEDKAVDIYRLMAELWNTVDHLIEEVEDLREALTLSEGALTPKERPRGGTILPKEEVPRGLRSDGETL